ncbi:MAG: glycosyltransferase [Alphaproteobacteria bacterium]|nr:glycosyltransferase [Alphaproteobacteria bacterium]
MVWAMVLHVYQQVDDFMSRHIGLVISDMGAGGAQRVVSELSSGWVQQGHRVTIFTFDTPDATSFFPLSSAVTLINLSGHGRAAGFISAIKANIGRIIKLRRALKNSAPDILLAFLPDMVFTAVMANGFSRPVIACERTNPAMYPTGLWRLVRDITYRLSDLIICQTQTAADYFNMPHKTRVIPNPVPIPNITGHSDIPVPERRFIASLGRLSFEKGHDILIRAFDLIAPDFPDIDLMIIGEGAEKDRLQAMCRYPERVLFAGVSQHPFPVLSKADIFVLPSRYEGFPNALAEAMILGLPCVVSEGADGGLIADEQNGRIVPVEDSEFLSTVLRSLLENPVQAKNLGDRARAISSRVDPAHVSRLWDQVISS